MFNSILQDVRRCGRSSFARLKEILFNPAMWAVFGYRVRRWVAGTLPRPLRWPLAPFLIFLQVGLELLTKAQFPTAARIGSGLYLPHLGTIVLGTGCTVGRNCTIAHNVTIGHAGGGRHAAAGNPVIGDRVYIGPGAIIIGPITIGDDALIGAGAVVVKSVPPRAVVVGNPARVISHAGSFDLIEYPGMESDAARIAALAAVPPATPQEERPQEENG